MKINMSKFSEKCRELLLSNGSNVYRLSQSASLERTSLQRMITGKRLPNQEFVLNFCHALRIPLSEEKELMELYKMESMGESAYKNQKAILNLFRQLADLEKTDLQPSCCITEQSNLLLLSNISSQSYNTELLLQFVLKNAFHTGGKSPVYTNLPGTCNLLSHYLHLLAPQYSDKIILKQLIHFHISDSSTFENLETLNQILPLYFSGKIDYEPYYYYSTLTNSEQSNLLFPYYIISADHVLQLSGDLKKGILHSDPAIVQHYTSEFLDKLSQATLLVRHTDSLKEVNDLYTSSLNILQVDEMYSLGGLYQMELVSQEDYSSLTKQYAADYMELFDNYTHFADMLNQSHQHIFAPLNSIRNFCNTGNVPGALSILFPSFDSEMRVNGLKNLCNTLSAKDISFLTDNFIFPDSVVLELYDHHLLHIIHVGKDGRLSFIAIHENSICEAFKSFFLSLPGSEYDYGKEKQKSFLQESICGIEALSRNHPDTPPDQHITTSHLTGNELTASLS